MSKQYHFYYDNGTHTIVDSPWQVINELAKNGDNVFWIDNGLLETVKLKIEEIESEQENQTQASHVTPASQLKMEL